MPGGWMVRKLDSLGGAVVAAVGGMAASQWPAFAQQYIQRLGGHIDEAKRNVVHLTSLHDLADPGQRSVIIEILTEAETRSQVLMESLRLLTEAGAVVRPFVFFREMDPEIARATLDAFVPAVPLETGALIWAGVGMVLALVLYELVKGTITFPVGLARRSLSRRNDNAPAQVERIEPRL